MKKLDLVNAIREIVTNEDNRKYYGYSVVAHFVHGLGNDNIRSASTIMGEYSKAELEDGYHYFNQTVLMHVATEEPIEVQTVEIEEVETVESLTEKIERIEYSLPVITSEENKMKLINQINAYKEQIRQMGLESDIEYFDTYHPIDDHDDELDDEILEMIELEEKIQTKIMQLTADQNEFDGDPDLYELYYHNKQIEIETLKDVLHMMKGGDE
jgi:hypothetical protein